MPPGKKTTFLMATRSRKPKPPPTVKRSTDPAVKRFVAAKKIETRLVGRVDRMLLAESVDSGHEDYRRDDVLHPSEICRVDWCPRASWYRIKMVRSGLVLPQETVSMRLEAIFEEGHEIHAKWQKWAWKVGNLAGVFDCLRCDHRWWSLAPQTCEKCQSPRKYLRYREVPVDGEERYLILGHGDGLLQDKDEPDSVLEVKSMSVGTVRKEWPQGMGKHSKVYELVEGGEHKCFDIDALWRDIRRPFPSHNRQGNIYGHILGVDYITYLYEHKGNQAYKEFTVKVSEEIWGPIIEAALDVKWGLEKDKPPDCSQGRGGCKHCEPFEEKTNASTTTSTTGGTATPRPRRPRALQDTARRPGDGPGDVGREDAGGTGEPGLPAPTTAARRLARPPGRPDAPGRLGVDDGDAPVHRVGRLPGRATVTR